MGGIAQGRQAKKLEAAARFWSRGGKDDGQDAVDDLALFGIRAEDAKAWIGEPDQQPETFAVWPDNWPTLTLFLALQTQWRLVVGAGATAYLGLDYSAAHATMQMLAIPRRERVEMFAGLMLMERAALPLLNARNDERGRA